MEMLFIYLVKSAALVATFWLAYYFLLRKETFFKSNRWYLLFGLVTSVLLPLVTFKKVILVEAQPMADFSHLSDLADAAPIATPETFEINWLLVLGILYGIGITLFLLRFFTDFYSLKKVLKGQKAYRQEDFRFVDTRENISPFSYFNYIVFNSSLYSDAELENILEHEKVHSNQNHTFDVLFARLFCIVFWFSPFVWLYKKSILQNLEFIADSEATKNIPDKKSYQITLLKVTAQENCVDITNHFYQSLIKKRIVMLNKNQSKKWNSWKYLLVIPALTAFMFYFQVDVVAQEKQIMLEDGSTVSMSSREVTDMTWDKSTTNEEFKANAAAMNKSGIIFKFSKIKRNANGEITAIKLSYKDKLGNQQTKTISGDTPIKPIHFIRDIDMYGKGKIGFFEDPKKVFLKGHGLRSKSSNNDDHASGENDDEDIDFIVNGGDVEIPELPEIPEVAEMETPELAGLGQLSGKVENAKSIIIKKGDGKPMIIVDGKIVSNEDMDKLDPETIAQVNALKGDQAKGYAYAYGKNGKDGVIVIDTKKITVEAMEKAREAMRKVRPERERAKIETRKARPQMEDAKREMEQARKEMEQAREEIRQARLELEKEKAELEKEKAEQKKK
jgi:beta-lactamase regulating signal transducer with metallopeptidase domain